MSSISFAGRPPVRVRPSAFLVFAVSLAIAFSARAQTLVVYDDALQNAFDNYSYGGGSDFNGTAVVRTGTKSIAFTGNAFNAVSFFHPGVDLGTAAYPVLRLWVHGGVTGGQQLRLLIAQGNPEGYYTSVDLDALIPGGIAAGEWREAVVNLGQAPVSAPDFNRIDIQSDVAGAQSVLYIDDVTVGQIAAAPVAPLTVQQNDTVAGMLGDRFIWRDSNNQVREAMLAYNNGQVGPGGGTGGSLRQYRYQLPNGATRTAGLTGYGAGDGGFGYVVMHASGSACVGDDSPLGGFQPGNGYERVFAGKHHAILRFRQNYPRNCAATGGAMARTIPVTIDWMFSTGRDHPVWAVTYDIDLASPAAAQNTFNDDSRAPYGELAIDGEGFTNLSGVAWGDRYRFTSTGPAPVTLNSAWDWTAPNSVPYVKEWLDGPLSLTNTLDATMGIVLTQTIAQQDAGGGRTAGGDSMTNFWTKTSATVLGGNACTNLGRTHPFPCANDWPYQANANSLDFTFPGGSNNARLTWKTQYGFIGQAGYNTYNGLVATAPGWPKKSYSTYIVLGTHTSGPVEAQVEQIETVQTLALSTTVGVVVTAGPAGVARADSVPYQPAGYNHVYGALAFVAVGNQLDANIAVEAGKTLKNPLLLIHNYTGGEPSVKFANATLIDGVDYFASLRPAANELWVTLNRNLTGATNRIEIGSASMPPGAPTISSVVAGNRQVVISFSPPASDGGSPITGYTATCNPGGISAPAAASPVTVSGLVNGFQYSCSVKALNANGAGPASAAVLVTPLIRRTDFNMDGKADLVLQSTSGDIALWTMNGFTITAGALVGTPGPAWKVVGTGDFNGDDKSDLILQNGDTGDVVVWLMSGPTITVGAVVAAPGLPWKMIASGDFDGNGRSDLVLQNSATGEIAQWQMNGTSITAAGLVASPGNSWVVVGSGDFNGDGKADILLQNRDTGAVAEWQMNGMAISAGAVLGSSGVAWKAVGTGDFDANGRSDILLRNESTGDVAVWLVNDLVISAGALIGSPGAGWLVMGAADFNGDGRADIILREGGSAIAEWQMMGSDLGGRPDLGTRSSLESGREVMLPRAAGA
jgi:hypothetical protein